MTAPISFIRAEVGVMIGLGTDIANPVKPYSRYVHPMLRATAWMAMREYCARHEPAGGVKFDGDGVEWTREVWVSR